MRFGWQPLTAILMILGSTQARAADVAVPISQYLPFEMPQARELKASKKKVFAHYFTQFPLSIDNRSAEDDYYTKQYLAPDGENGKHKAYGGFLRDRPLPRAPRPEANWPLLDKEEEVRRADAIGLDGFSCDLLGYEGGHWKAALDLLDAAQHVDPNFKILLMPDMEAAFKQNPEKLSDAILALSKYPAAYRMDDGRLVVSPYRAELQTPEWWKNWLADMKAKGVDIAFVPLFHAWSSHAQDYASISTGMSDWGWRSPEVNKKWRDIPAQAHKFVPIWMMPVAPQDARPRPTIYWEAGNSENYRVMWENAILGRADWVQLITWNDYSENTHVSPSAGTQWSFYDLTAYYTVWFKTGTPPKIRRDALLYFYRNQSTEAQPDLSLQTKPFSPTNGSDAPRNEIEVIAFLTQPGTVEISVGGETKSADYPAGMNSFRAPLREGKPVFRLTREGKTVIETAGKFEISNRITYQDPLYRGGSSLREP